MQISKRVVTLLVVMMLLPGAAAAQFRARPYVAGLNLPVGMVQHPSDPAVQYIVEQGGLVRIISHGVLLGTPFIDLSATIIPPPYGEQGLLGLAFPADHASTGRFYVNFTNQSGNVVVRRYTRSTTNPLVADPTVWLDLRWSTGLRYIEHPFSNHNGGHLAFGPDGYFYIGLGDGGGSNDPQRRAQNPNDLLGKMLRIDVSVPDGNLDGFQVPPDNPFLDDMPVDARPEIWSFGLRNPWRYTFDDPAHGGTGALVIGDVGQGAWEEIDYEPAGAGGRNYGWPRREGAHPNPNAAAAMVPLAYPPNDGTYPIHEYPHGASASITGGFVYRGGALPSRFYGRYLYADLFGKVWSVGLNVDQGTGEATAFGEEEHTSALGGAATLGFISAWGTDAAGELYILSHNVGAIFKIVGLSTPGDLVGDFGASYGIWTGSFSAGWSPLHPLRPESFTSGDLDGNGIEEVIVDFGAPHGIWIWMNNVTWVQLHLLSASHLATADLDRSGQDEVVVDFPGYGIYIRWNNAFWTQLHLQNSSQLAAGNLDGAGGDDLIVDFPGQGIWVYYNGSSWIKLHALNGSRIVPGDFDANGMVDVAIDFPGFGIWIRANNASWIHLHALGATHMAAGNIDSDPRHELVVDFGAGHGIWVLRNGVSWFQLHTVTAERIVVNDVDRNGQDDITVDFGSAYGLWAYFNHAGWGQLHYLSPDDMVPANLR